MRILDRSLQSGVGYKIICEAYATPASASASTPAAATETKSTATETKEKKSTGKSKAPKQEAEPLLQPPKVFSVALGKAVSEPELPALLQKGNWYASRKLDGVRCVLFVRYKSLTTLLSPD